MDGTNVEEVTTDFGFGFGFPLGIALDLCAGVDCTALNDQCNDGVCDPLTGACVAQAKADGTTCGDGVFCNGAETCVSGVCQAGPNPCPGQQACDEAGDTCVDCSADSDADGILFCVDLDPINGSNQFSDDIFSTPAVVTADTVSVPVGATVTIKDAQAANQGVRVDSTDAPDGSMVELNFTCAPGLVGKPTGKSIWTCGSLTVEVIEGATTVVFTIDEVEHEVVVDAGGTATLEETTDTTTGELLGLTVTSAPDSVGPVTVDGQTVVPGQTADVLGVVIDIKPGSFPNSINLGSNGTVPVAIFSTATFDATSIDPLTVSLAGAGVRIRGRAPQFRLHDVNNDGLLDMVIHVETEALELSDTDTEAALTASADTDGDGLSDTIIRGLDTVRVVP